MHLMIVAPHRIEYDQIKTIILYKIFEQIFQCETENVVIFVLKIYKNKNMLNGFANDFAF